MATEHCQSCGDIPKQWLRSVSKHMKKEDERRKCSLVTSLGSRGPVIVRFPCVEQGCISVLSAKYKDVRLNTTWSGFAFSASLGPPFTLFTVAHHTSISRSCSALLSHTSELHRDICRTPSYACLSSVLEDAVDRHAHHLADSGERLPVHQVVATCL